MDDKREKTKRTYDLIADLYTADFGDDHGNFDLVDAMVSSLREQNMLHGRHVDLGAGPGNVTDYLRERGLARIEAVDFSDAFIGKLREKYRDTPEVEVIGDDMIENMRSRGTESVQSVVASYSVIHIPDEEVDGLFADIARVLVPGGMFVMSCHKGKEKKFEAEPYQVSHDVRLTVEEPLSSYVNYFTEEELDVRLSRVGLVMKKIRTFFVPPAGNDFPTEKIWVLTEKPRR